MFPARAAVPAAPCRPSRYGAMNCIQDVTTSLYIIGWSGDQKEQCQVEDTRQLDRLTRIDYDDCGYEVVMALQG